MNVKLEKLLEGVDHVTAQGIRELFRKFPLRFHCQDVEYMILCHDHTWRTELFEVIVFSEEPYHSLPSEEKMRLLDAWGKENINLRDGEFNPTVWAVSPRKREDND